MHDDNGEPFIATLYNLFFLQTYAIDFFYHCVNEFRTYFFFYKGFFTFLFSDNEQSAVTLTHITQRKHAPQKYFRVYLL